MKTLLLSFSLLILSANAWALDVEKLFMPGPVIKEHAEYEANCEKCHNRLQNKTQDTLCRECHEKVDGDIRDNAGFHGKSKAVKKSECKICHADHKGRDAQIVHLDVDRFNHRDSDFELVGKHLQTECAGCHKAGKKYRETPTKCFSCHEEDDAHEGKLGEKCKQCHNPRGWGSEKFDHDKTDFKLRGSHEKVACDLCHHTRDYKDTPKKCVSCHAIKDVHQGRFGKKCEDCHQEKDWAESQFDHAKDAQYKLEGTHKRVNCHGCHATGYHDKRAKKNPKPERKCYDCHRLDDPHKGNNGKKCEQCHNQDKWAESNFDHDAKTEFPLRGAHEKATCQSCHLGDKKDQKPDKACYSCHKLHDAHNEQQGKRCESCHNDRSWWMEDVRFDHELADFPLIGLHAVAACEACHLSSRFKDVDSDCKACHANDDVHEKALGEDCHVCHTPNAWLIWTFDHDETNFPLEGVHADIHCHTCHNQALDKIRSDSKPPCVDCHHRDDIHGGNFGPNCDDCHSQKDFKTITLDILKTGY